MTTTVVPAPYGWWMREEGTDQWFPVVAWAIKDGEGDKGPRATVMTVESFKTGTLFELRYDAEGAPA